VRRIIFLFLILLFPIISYADEGTSIDCLNLKAAFGKKKYKPLNFKLEATGFHYFDKKTNKYEFMSTDKLEIGENFFAARFEDYELGFQTTKFECVDARLTMSKYDYKNDKFLEHYACHAKRVYID
tara:strand:- start:125 stop:502 length:378 start_codon:yes stop_codon:yes gene_type:complete